MATNRSALNWPNELDRTPDGERESGSKFSTNFRQTKSDLKRQMELLEVEQWRLDDVTGSGGDPGVVLRWTKNGDDFVVACDGYTTKAANIREIYLWVQETRKRADREVETGGSEFAAARLPPGTEDDVEPQKPPHEVLEVRPDASDEVVKAVARRKMANHHSDTGDGDEEAYKRVQKAKQQMLGDG